MRGHGKSEIGTKRYSYQLFAEDALAILKQEKADSVMVVGFSAVAMGGAIDTSGYRAGAFSELKTYAGADYENMLPDLVKARKKLMPKPNSYNELVEKLKAFWLQPVYVEKEKLAAIKCPVLTVAGDRDVYIAVMWV
jgi:pimeloyl-ACP methyl ester carboxylesterase